MRNIPATLPLSLCHLSEINASPVELLEAAGKAGFSSISLRFAPIVPSDVNFPLVNPSEQHAVRSAINATGVSLLFMEFLWMVDGPAPVDTWLRVLESGKSVGASRLMVGGMSDQPEATAEKFAQICELAASHDVAVDLEPIAAAKTASFAQGVEIVRKAGTPKNAGVLLDVLHFARANGTMDDLKRGADLISVFHLCDAPAKPPAGGVEAIAKEASENRLLPGDGSLAIWPLITEIPQDCLMGVEVPMNTLFPDLTSLARLTKLHDACRRFLTSEPNSRT